MEYPSFPTVKRLFAVSGNVCAFPDCCTPLVEETSGKVTGRICHIKAQSQRGPRHDPTQSEEERHGFENLILMCPIHHDVIDADHDTYTVERLRQIKASHESSHSVGGTVMDSSDEIVGRLLVNVTSANLSDGSVVTSVNQSGGQTAHSITNIERQVVLNKQYTNEHVTLDTFAIDRSKCAYEEHRLDVMRPFWPEEADPITVSYMPGGKVRLYGKEFDSRAEAEKHGDTLRQKYNHYSFYEGAPHTMFFDRVDESLSSNPPNYPVFYVSISNHTNSHIVLSEIVATVHHVQPLEAIGESHTLVSLTVYKVEVAPAEGTYRIPAVPSLKIESGDAAAFHVLLKPNVGMMGGYHWLITLNFRFDRNTISSETFSVVM